MSDEYSLLSPFIQKYIYEHGWKELRDIQSRAIRIILKSDYHLLLASGTASGKTEAAFFPILTLLEMNPSSSVGILYVSPLKALINDQFERLEGLLEKSEIPLWHWHGDVSTNEKRKALRNPSGVMQITPESLESLIMRHTADIPRLFSDLRFVVIDEVHSFMGQERGSQLLCLLKRMEILAGCHPRRIGLSATISEYQEAKKWLSSGTERQVALAKSDSVKKKELSVRHYNLAAPDDGDVNGCFSEEEHRFYSDLYDSVYHTNSIIFTNSRKTAEFAAVALKKIAHERKENEDVFQVHHGSLSASLREEAEDALRNKFTKSVVVTTTTLELGIDIGELDKVVQLGSPFSCSSYVQRLGRSGRRGAASNMQFYCFKDDEESQVAFDSLPWDLLKSIAIIELYDESGWIEPFYMPKKPFSLLYQQTLSVLYSSGGMKSGRLAKIVLSLSPFEQISKEEYKQFLLYLLEIGHLEKTSDNLLLVGLKAESHVNHYKFLAVFEEKQTYKVMEGIREIGTVESFNESSQYLTLGGKYWKILSVNEKTKVIEVSAVDDVGSIAIWNGSAGSVHSRIFKKVREVLLSDEEYAYLDAAALARLKDARAFARKYAITDCLVCRVGNVSYIFPWVGELELETLKREIKCRLFDKYSLKFGRSGSYYLAVRGDISVETLKEELRNLRKNHCDPYSLVSPSDQFDLGKYSTLIPPDLRIVEFAEDFIKQDFEYL